MKLSEFCMALDKKLGSVNDHERTNLSSLSLQQAFKVEQDEVAFLKFDEQTGSLHFVWPEKLGKSGSIPVNTKGSFAAETIRENKPQLHNRFASKHHSSIFEQINLDRANTQGSQDSNRPNTIQKIMSVPMSNGDALVGVIQVSRKADSTEQAGPDFSKIELEALSEIAKVIGKHI